MPGEAAAQFNIHDAKTNLSRIIERVEHGEEIIISRAGNPVAKVVPPDPQDRPGRRAVPCAASSWLLTTGIPMRSTRPSPATSA